MINDETNLLGFNVRRLMARNGMQIADLCRRSKLDVRTVIAILQGHKKPHARSIQRIAKGLGVSTDELFADPGVLAHRVFDRATNPEVDEVIQESPRLFRNWSPAEFDDLYSRFGHGGALTREGVIEAAKQINRRREVVRKVTIIMETDEGDLLESIVDAMYQRVVLTE